ncbi:MAG: DNA primase [Chloroflexota bacterium]|nr:DNA primase [Chloroflexota bacterium]
MPDSTIDEIKRRLDIVDVIGESVPLKRAGRSFKGLCPFHGEKTPSFHVSPERQSWHCFGCGRGGDIFSFVQERESVGFAEALRVLAEGAGVELQERQRPDPTVRERKDRLTEILESTALFYRGLLQSDAGANARAYLAGRGVTQESIERFGLGYAEPTGRALERHLIKAGYGVDEAVEAGALGRSDDGRTYDRFRDRVVFPIRDAEGRAIGFGGRALRPDQQPKYLNSPQTDIFDKGANLYALDQARAAIREAGRSIVVEGYLDALIPHQAGFRNVVATLGTALTERHVQVLRNLGREIVLCLDSDLAGLRAAQRGSSVAHDGTADEAVRIDLAVLNRWERPRRRDQAQAAIFLERRTLLKVMTLEGGKDPDEVVRQDPTAWTRAVEAAQPVIDFVLANLNKIFDLDSTDGRREAARAAVGLIYDVADPIDRDRHLQRLAAVIGTQVDVLHEFARRSLRLVPPRSEAEAAPTVTPATSRTASPEPSSAAIATPRDRSYEDRLADLVIALRIRAPEDAPWPEPADFEDAAHRALLELLRAAFPWPDAQTAFDRLRYVGGDALAEFIRRIEAVDRENERLAPPDLVRELRVRALELRKLRLFRQHQALDSALREEVGAMSSAERREYHERLARIAAELGGIFAEQRELGVVGSASWSIRRGREVLGG